MLTGLHEISKQTFAQRVRLISSVSGGSVGTFYFLSAYREGNVPQQALGQIYERAAASSLDDVAWGVVYPDLFRLLTPFFMTRNIGRGWALEHSWAGKVCSGTPKDPDCEETKRLSDWREPAKNGSMPAVIFNTTVVETGERAAFSTVDRAANAHGARTFYELYPESNIDVKPVTAARLSATFPYVSPAARANWDLPRSKRFHFVDGGYWDNFGIASAIEFLRQAVDGGSQVKHILLIEIRDRKEEKSTESSGRRGSLFQTVAPIFVLYNVRGNGQVSRNEVEVDLLKSALKPDITLCHAVFESPQTEAPLSWHLTTNESEAIKQSWSSMTDPNKNSDLSTTLEFLKGNFNTAGCK